MTTANHTRTASSTIIRLPEVLSTTGLSRPTVYRKVKEGSFPQPLRLGAAAVGWLLHEIEQWITTLAEARHNGIPVAGLEPGAASS
jgi:prophage regulatory protein